MLYHDVQLASWRNSLSPHLHPTHTILENPGCRQAGSKRLTLRPCFTTRLTTIYAYTFPADAAAEQLVHLYVQKGHAASDCKRFLKRPKKTAVIMRSTAKRLCVRVCHPPSLGVVICRGPARDTLANEASDVSGMRSETSDRAPAMQLLITLSTSLVCFHGRSHDTSL